MRLTVQATIVPKETTILVVFHIPVVLQHEGVIGLLESHWNHSQTYTNSAALFLGVHCHKQSLFQSAAFLTPLPIASPSTFFWPRAK